MDRMRFWKMIAFGAMGMYVYNAMKENGGTLQGNPHGINLNSDKLVDHAMLHIPVHPNIRPIVESACKKVAKEILHNAAGRVKMKDVGRG